MTDLQAVVLGALQGATEWLPISSTAHLRVAPALLGWPDPGAAFTAISQIGTLFAALVYFRKDLAAMLFSAGEGRAERPGRQHLVPILAGTAPIVVCGVLFQKWIKNDWRSLHVVSWSLIVFAVLLALAERRAVARRGMDSVTVRDGLVVGIGQMFALIPGASRSGTTITAALFAGFERATAARFSFLLSLPAVALAGIKEFLDERHAILSGGQLRPVLLATVVAFLVGWASIHWLLTFLKRHPAHIFVAYRIALGVALLILLGVGRLAPQ